MMEKKILSRLFLLLCASLLFSACGERIHEEGNGNISQETRNVGAFFELEIEGEYEIVLQEGASPLVAVETDENLHQYVETVIDGRTLRIRNVERIKPSAQTRLIITYQRLEAIRLGGATNLSNSGTLRAETLQLRVDGAGLVDLHLAAEELGVRLAGAGSVGLRGNVDQQEIHLSGAGNLDASELESKACNIEISGVGNAQVFVTDNLEAEVSGVGSVRFKGDPRNLRREVTGVGRIERVKAN
jgi:hypothetical protein